MTLIELSDSQDDKSECKESNTDSLKVFAGGLSIVKCKTEPDCREETKDCEVIKTSNTDTNKTTRENY